MALAGQPAGGRVPLLWGSDCLPLLAGDCSTLCGQVRSWPSRLSWSRVHLRLPGARSVFLSHREPRPAAWTVYAATVTPLHPLFAPARFVSHILVHEGYNSHTHANDIALVRLREALDLTGAPFSVFNTQLFIQRQKTRLTPCPAFRGQRGPRVPPKRRSEHH